MKHTSYLYHGGMDLPTPEQVARERERLNRKSAFTKSILTTIFVFVVAAALSVLIATIWLPVLQVSGSSMEPSLYDGEIVLVRKTTDFDTGDLIGFYYQNKILLKRAIGFPGDTIEIDEEGTVQVNGVTIDEPYLREKALGQCDISFPFQVPDGQTFVMGDHRETSIDSRSREVGCVRKERVVGQIVFRIWPLNRIGFVS